MPVVHKSTPLIAWSNPAPIVYGTALTSSELNATANVPGSFVYSPAPGSVPSAGTKILSATFTPSDTSAYDVAAATVSLTVQRAPTALTWSSPPPLPYNSPLGGQQLNAIANVPGTFAYTPAPGATLPVGTQTLSVAFSPADAVDYLPSTATVPLTIVQATPVISWPTPAAITYGTVLSASQLKATANLPGTFSYNPAYGALLDAGSQTLSVTFTPADSTDYASATVGVTLLVNPATPVLTWAAPAPVALGTALSASQLNAVATAPGGSVPVEGNYLYTPAAGTRILSTGTQTLHIVFTPTDGLDYTPASASTTLTITPFGVVTWGDSLTYPLNSVNYPDDLQKLIYLPVQNEGISGQTSTQIGVREGGVLTDASVSGEMIPAAGGVNITFRAGHEPVTYTGQVQSVSGTILGVHGTVTRTLDEGVPICTFKRSSPGDPVPAPGAPQFVVDTPYLNFIPIFWEGRNNFADGQQVLSDIAAQVATVPPGKTYLVMSVINGETTNEWKGNISYNQITAINNQLSSTYGSNYLDIRKVLVDSYDPSWATDVDDYKNDEPPTSLRAITGSGTLAASIGPGEQSITVNLTAGKLTTGNILTIDTGANAENVFIHSASGNTAIALRGYGGLTISHPAGVTVTQNDGIHLNASGYQIVANAVAGYLSAYANSAK